MGFSTRLVSVAAAIAATAMASTVANAAFLNAPVPTNAYITQGGLDWAWAFPLPAGSGLDLSFQSGLGWRLPTVTELASAPDAVDFMFAGANVPLGGVDPISGASFSAVNGALVDDAACATPYFSNSFRHCDWQDGNGQTFEPWAGSPGAFGFADQLVVRASNGGTQVPEPEALALLGMAILGLGLAGRRTQR